jgi:hypothetical protein
MKETLVRTNLLLPPFLLLFLTCQMQFMFCFGSKVCQDILQPLTTCSRAGFEGREVLRGSVRSPRLRMLACLLVEQYGVLLVKFIDVLFQNAVRPYN